MIGCRPLSDVEFKLVLRAFSGPYEHRDRLLFVLGCSTGFRVSELLSLTIEDLWRHDRPVARIKVSAKHMKKNVRIKDGKRRVRVRSRTAVLTPIAARFLTPWLGQLSLKDSLDPAAPLFSSRKHSRSDGPAGPRRLPRALSRVQAYRILRAAFEYAEIDLAVPGTHTLRKTFAADLYNVFNGNIFMVQKALGHASPASTVAYLSFDESELDQAVSDVWSKRMEDTD